MNYTKKGFLKELASLTLVQFTNNSLLFSSNKPGFLERDFRCIKQLTERRLQ